MSKASGGTFDSRGETFRRDRWSSMSQVSKYDTDSPDSPDSPPVHGHCEHFNSFRRALLFLGGMDGLPSGRPRVLLLEV